MDIKNLRALIQLAKEEGLKTLSFNGIKFELSAQPKSVTSQAGQLEALTSDIREPTEDEMLLWSTDYYDELRTQRKEATLPPAQVPENGH